MRLAFFGTPAFAGALLQDLIDAGHIPVAVVTQSDKPQGRSKELIRSPVKEIALKYNLPLFQPLKASDPQFWEDLRALKPDLLVVVAYGQILKLPLLELAPRGAINVHASLLPHLRGAAPIQRSLMQGDKVTGVTIMKMSVGMDEGDILLQESLEIAPEWNAEDLRLALLPLARHSLLQVLSHMPEGVPQNHKEATYAPKLEGVDAYVDFQKTAQEVHNHIRGCNPEPGSWTKVVIKGIPKKLKIIKASLLNTYESSSPGEILGWSPKEGIIIGCQKGAVRLDVIQLEGKKTCDAAPFTLGYYKDDVRIG